MNKENKSAGLRQLCQDITIMPVLVVKQLSMAKPLAQTLLSSGFSILEVTLRTPSALEVIDEMSSIDNVVVAAGTITNADQLKSAKQAGASFGVTPGLTPSILAAAQAENFPLLPGVATVSEMMNALEQGYDFLKFFPAENLGGVSTLKSFSGPFPDVKFCPTGGISMNNAASYLALENVMCVGGSWLAPDELVENQQWQQLGEQAAQALESLK